MSEPQPTQPATPPRLSPKEQFLHLEDAAAKWRGLARGDLHCTVLTYAFAEFALSSPEPSSEQIRAVRNFIETLLNIAEPKSPPRGAFPERRLTSPEAQPTKTEEKKK
jgi:hypothetical protein